MRVRPRYWKPPRDTCQLCGASLYQAPRYRVKLYLRAPRGTALAATPYKTLVVCQACLARLRRDPALTRLFRARHRRMPTLGAPRRTPAGNTKRQEEEHSIRFFYTIP